jgi:methionyl aminopeptidase
MGIVIKNELEIEKMQEAGRIVRAVLDAVEAACVPGVSTAELNRIAQREMLAARAESALLGYALPGHDPYPAVLCTSVDEVVVHGIPREDELLVEGSLVGIDFACHKHGYFADAARTVAIGVVSQPARALLEHTRQALALAVQACVPGGRLGDIGAAIEGVANTHGYGLVRDFVGHGIGRRMHEPPNVLNYGQRGRGLRLREGLVIAIEPMFTLGTDDVCMLDDGWSVVTADGSAAVHVEHTVAITREGPRVLAA